MSGWAISMNKMSSWIRTKGTCQTLLMFDENTYFSQHETHLGQMQVSPWKNIRSGKTMPILLLTHMSRIITVLVHYLSKGPCIFYWHQKKLQVQKWQRWSPYSHQILENRQGVGGSQEAYSCSELDAITYPRREREEKSNVHMMSARYILAEAGWQEQSVQLKPKMYIQLKRKLNTHTHTKKSLLTIIKPG